MPALQTPQRFLRTARAAAVLCALLAQAGAQAAQDDDAPLTIEADALRHDAQGQTSEFTGHVVATRGSVLLRGASLTVRRTADGQQSGVLSGDAQGRAFFRQKLETAPGQPEEFVEGEGEVMEYDGGMQTLRFLRRSELRRYRGGQLSDSITGASITYDRRTDVFTVDGKRPAGTDGRVRAVIAPRPAQSRADAPPPPPPSVALPPLRSSGSVDSPGQP